MSQKKFVEFRGAGIWSYDVALSILLKHVIDVAETKAVTPCGAWLSEVIPGWRLVAAVSDYGLEIGPGWSSAEIAQFVELVEEACAVIDVRSKIAAYEIAGWHILDDISLDIRGAKEVRTGPIAELGGAIIDLVHGTLAEAPGGKAWLYGTSDGPELI